VRLRLSLGNSESLRHPCFNEAAANFAAEVAYRTQAKVLQMGWKV
jgi:hypothetical protein